MKLQRYFPSRVPDQTTWLENFRNKLPQYIVPLGLDPVRANECIVSCGFAIYVFGSWLEAARTFNLAATAASKQLFNGDGTKTIALPAFTPPELPEGVAPVATGALKRIFDLVALIKLSRGYTETIGLDLGIVEHSAGAAAVTADSEKTPETQFETEPGKVCQAVRINFIKRGHMGVWIETRRGNGAWEFLGIDTESPYLDDRPLLVEGQPEVREYRLAFWDKGARSGDWSTEFKITVSP